MDKTGEILKKNEKQQNLTDISLNSSLVTMVYVKNLFSFRLHRKF